LKDLLEKLSSYNLFNYLLPGILFVILAEKITAYSFIQQDIIIGVFLYYFIGLVVSRVGSLTIEPFLKKIKFLKFADYPDFVAASKKDEKLDILSEQNNSYRTICSLFFLLLLLKIFEIIQSWFPALKEWDHFILLILLLVLFLLSYRKQTNYITKRVKANL